MKIDDKFTKNAYNNLVDEYHQAALNVKLWQSEKQEIEKYFTNKEGFILDMGCGAGRTTFGLLEMGYTNLTAIDLSDEMIKKANETAIKYEFKFEVGNCLDIEYQDEYFDNILFSFNGLMQIPKHENRVKALIELKRVLKPNGIMIFTTHDRSCGSNAYLDAWREERRLWLQDKNDVRLHELGDVFISTNGQEYFIHIPTFNEMEQLLNDQNLQIIDTFMRSERYDENDEVIDFSDDCRFWIVRK